ncbi:acyl-CoA thioesterase [Marinilongibacter aquaticus]|uniref:acyl-CoA thioesterase n=1 Tax=Marinilongibacter aquaticus TaxID=2975157 RepID=UPI0021BD2819|nr:thioesterase family protein [Marinilongibacter aquaticus]UBM58930.1 acyl-CoA thioesterase [Marinilongibacter aquaticus]
MFSFECTYRVRYADIDKMGFMYYGHYARLFEIARVEALRALGVRYRDLEDAGVIMPVRENKSKYLAPAKYDDLLTIKAMIKSMPGRRIVFDYEIANEEKKLIHIGETTLVFLNLSSQRVVECPEMISEVLRPYFPAEND